MSLHAEITGIQLKFDEAKIKNEVRKFPVGTFIYPEKSHSGVLQNDVVAVRLLNLAGKQVNIKGYTGWESRDQVVLYFDNRTWTLPPLTYFGAPPKKGKIIR